MTTLSDSSVLEPSPERPSREYHRGLIIEPGLALNTVAADIYKLLDGNRTLKAVAATISSEYDVTEQQCLTDVINLATELVEEGVIRVNSQDSTV